MTPEQKLKWAILARVAQWNDKIAPDYPCSDIDEQYDELVSQGNHWDAKEEVRSGGVETGLDCDFSRHYESKAVAMKMPDGSWVGWVYWYGGGKHGEPGAVDWMEYAYNLECKEEEKLITVTTFKRM